MYFFSRHFGNNLQFLQQLKEQTGHTKQEFLPNIYDNSNHLDVSEYVDDIYQYYWVMEVIILLPSLLILCVNVTLLYIKKKCLTLPLCQTQIQAQSHPLKSYMEFQTEITPQMRGILINWLIEVHIVI